MDRLLEHGGFQYTTRIQANEDLTANITHLSRRPSRHPRVYYESFQYQAQSRDHPRRVVPEVEWHAEESFPRVGFIVTNMADWP